MSSTQKKGSDLVIDLLRAYPGRSAAMISFLLLSGLAEGVGVMTLLPLIDLATGGKEMAATTLGRWTRELFALFGATPTLGGLLVLIVIGLALKGAFTLVAMKEVGYAVAHVMTDLRLQLIRALLAARWRYFVSQPVGALANAISNEAARASQVYQAAALLLALVIQVIVYSTLVLAVSWQVALAGVFAGSAFALVFRSLIETTRRAGSAQTDLLKSLTARLVDALHGIKPIKAMGQEKQLLPLLEAETRGLNEAQQSQVWSAELMRVLQEPLLAMIIAVGLYAALTFGSHSFSALMVLVFLFYRLLNRVQAIQQVYQAIAAGESAYLSLRDSIDVARAEQETDASIKKPAGEFREIRFDRVHFGYGEKIVLQEVSLTLNAGDFIAIIGPSGAGKTTLADMLARLVEPQSGSIFVDGIPLRELQLAAWRQQIGYVPQESLLFHDTVHRNISLGDSETSREDVEMALRLAGAWDFVTSLPGGLNTMIGERGAKLSGGQRQRLSLARALARKPRLLILDEVTSALDPKTEEEICATLSSLAEKVTIIAVSHQPAIVRAAHRAYRMAEGRLEPVSVVVPEQDLAEITKHTHVQR